MKTSTAIWIVVILLVLGGLGWYYLSANPAAPVDQTATVNSNDSTGATTTPNTTTGTSTTPTPTTTAPKTVTVTYTANGFSPSTVTINKGDSVTFVNQGTGQMWVGADEHPTHTEFDGTSRTAHCAAGYTGTPAFDQCKNGNSYTFTFTKSGNFDYHNHSKAADGGTVVVQ